MRKDNIGDMLHLIEGKINDKELLEKYNIDTLVDASRPDLMGVSGEESVDGAIHGTIDDLLRSQNSTFKERIREELDEDKDEAVNKIRCQRGEAVITKGYGLCKYIIHAVGTEADTVGPNKTDCSFSQVQKLSECYSHIVDLIKSNRDIENIAIPIISSGNYGFNYIYAFKIAIASIGNALIEWKTRDHEFFETAGLKNIYFIMYTQSDIDKKNCYIEFEKYSKMFKRNKKVVYQTSFKTHLEILKDVRCNDDARGYFLIAKWTRYLLMLVRMIFFPLYMLKELFGGIELFKRRCVVEIFTITKALLPILIYLYISHANLELWKVNAGMAVLIYCMADTITYLLALVLMADIQPPSANIIRSMILLFVNYFEVVFDISVLYFLYNNYFKGISINIHEALEFGILGRIIDEGYVGIFNYLNSGVTFFFLTMVFGYLAINLKPKKFDA